jgi:hypothetical protein
MKKLNKKGNINMLIGGAIAFVVLFVTLAVMQLTLSKIGDNPAINIVYGNESFDAGNTSAIIGGDINATNTINDGQVALGDLSSLATILVFVLFLAVVVGFFALLGYGAYRMNKG